MSKRLLKHVSASAQYVQQVLGLMMSNQFISNVKFDKLRCKWSSVIQWWWFLEEEKVHFENSRILPVIMLPVPMVDVLSYVVFPPHHMGVIFLLFWLVGATGPWQFVVCILSDVIPVVSNRCQVMIMYWIKVSLPGISSQLLMGTYRLILSIRSGYQDSEFSL